MKLEEILVEFRITGTTSPDMIKRRFKGKGKNRPPGSVLRRSDRLSRKKFGKSTKPVQKRRQKKAKRIPLT